MLEQEDKGQCKHNTRAENFTSAATKKCMHDRILFPEVLKYYIIHYGKHWPKQHLFSMFSNVT